MRKKRVVSEPFDKILGKMREMRLTQQRLSEELNISIVTLNKKLNGSFNFSWEEMEALIRILDIPKEEVAEYFFADLLRKRNRIA